MHISSRNFLVIAALALGGILLLLFGLDSTEEVPRSLLGKRPAPLPSIDDSLTSGAVDLTRWAADPEERAADLPEAPLGEQASRQATIRGVVCEEGTGLPYANCEVMLSEPVGSWVQANGDLPDPLLLRAGTNEWGHFAFDLPSERVESRDLHGLAVTSSAGDPLFKGFVPLQDMLVILVPGPISITGVLISDPPLEYDEISVHVYAPSSGSSSLCGSARLDSGGTFTATVVPARGCQEYMLLFTRNGLSGGVSIEMPSEDLFSGEDLIIRRSLATLCVTCKSVDGKLIGGAKVRAVPVSSSGPLPSVDRLTTPDGQACFFVSSGTVEVCAGKEGHEPAIELLDVQDGSGSLHHELQLASVESALTGVVLDHRGAPAERAFVSVRPVGRSSDARLAGIAGIKTDSEGRFSLPKPRRPSELTAYHKDYGLTAPIRLVGDENFLRILFEPVGRVHVRLLCRTEEDGFFSGPVEYFLVDRFVERSLSDAVSPPLLVQNVPEGQYNLFVRVGDLYGEGSLQVVGGEDNRIDLELTRGAWFQGVVLERDGGAAYSNVIRVHHPAWPREIRMAWGSALTTRAGRFHVFGGHLTRAELEILSSDRCLGQVELDAGTEGVVRIDE